MTLGTNGLKIKAIPITETRLAREVKRLRQFAQEAQRCLGNSQTGPPPAISQLHQYEHQRCQEEIQNERCLTDDLSGVGMANALANSG